MTNISETKNMVVVPKNLKELMRLIEQLPADMVLELGYVDDQEIIRRLDYKAIKQELLQRVEDEVIMADDHPLIGGGYQHDEDGEPIPGTLCFNFGDLTKDIARNKLRAEQRQALKKLKEV